MSAILIRNASFFSPAPLGVQDMLIIHDRIVAIAPDIDLPDWLGPVEELDGRDLLAVPGFIDAHVHITGGGGEAGFSSQVPPLPLSKLTRSGVTTVGGLLGTDGVTRHVDAVLAKANSLADEGVSAFIMSGGYPVPSPTLTGSIRSDIAFIDRVRGGKIAIADHRVAPVSPETLLDVATQVRVGGMLRGFIGMLIMHVGGAAEGLSCVFAALERAPHLARHLIATHINRSPFAFAEAVRLAAKGGFMDISSGLNAQTLGPETLKPSEAVAEALRQGVAPERILMSSDGNGSAARYGDDGSVSGLVASDLGSLHAEFADCVREGLSISEALAPVTRNVAQAFSLIHKGHLAVGADADVLLLTPDLDIHTVIARGGLMMYEGRLLKKGTFEE